MTSSPTPERPDTAAQHRLSRRAVIGGAAAAAAAASLGAGLIQPAAASTGTPKVPGSVSQPPSPPERFTSQFINANGLRQHVVTGGDGPPLLLVHGWPQTWYQWRLVMPALARQFTVIAPDQRGRGLTSKPAPGPDGTGYDTGTLGNDLAALMDALGYQQFAVATRPADEEFAPGLRAFFATAGRPENRPFLQSLFQKGFQQPDGIETDLGTAIGKLRQNQAATAP
jgi:hypothetical protein